jgi:hypothetical protein
VSLRLVYSISSGADWLANRVPPEYALTDTELTPGQVSGATKYVTEISLPSPPLKDITDEAITVSSPQLEMAENVTRYLPFPDEQLVSRLNTPTPMPGDAVVVLSTGVARIAQAVEPPPPPPPLPPLPRCPNKGAASRTRQTHINAHFNKRFSIIPPGRTELSLKLSRECLRFIFLGSGCAEWSFRLNAARIFN